MNAIPLELKEANAFVEKLHRHIRKCREIASQCNIEGILTCDDSVFECLSEDFAENNGKLSAYIDIEE